MSADPHRVQKTDHSNVALIRKTMMMIQTCSIDQQNRNVARCLSSDSDADAEACQHLLKEEGMAEKAEEGDDQEDGPC